jgi:HKD family nuclease
MNLQNICDGDLEELKQIPKIQFTEAFSKQILVKMERNIQDLQIKYNCITDEEMKFGTYSLLEKMKKIENCILYIKKIK